MKYVKMLGLLAVAAAALMAFAGSASATSLTSSAGSTPTIHATAGETTLHGFATVTCKSSTVEGAVESHGTHIVEGKEVNTTVEGSITSLSFAECLPNHVTVLTNGTGTKGTGTLAVHADTKEGAETGDGILTSNGTRVTIQNTNLGISCIFETQNTTIGTVDGGITNAKLTIESAGIPRVGHSFFCGSNGIWTGSYTVNSPHNLEVH